MCVQEAKPGKARGRPDWYGPVHKALYQAKRNALGNPSLSVEERVLELKRIDSDLSHA